jgi:hypothetical protein
LNAEEILNPAIDFGTVATKLHTGEIFPSGYSEIIYNMASQVMTVDGKKYAMALFNEKAQYDTNSDKSLNKNIRLNYLYSLHKLTKDDIGIYTGALVSLPALQWKNDNIVARYKKIFEFENNVPKLVDLNGVSKELYVDDVEVVPEDSMAYYSDLMQSERFNKRRVLIVGLGSFNMNQILYENDEMIDCDTVEIGCLKIFQDMASAINCVSNTNIVREQMHDIYQHGLKNIDVKTLVKPVGIIYEHQIYRQLKLRWSVDTIPFVILIGGGNIIMADYIKELIPHAELAPNPQVIAALGMGEVVRMVF